MLCPWTRCFIRIASVDSAEKWVPGGDNLMKGVQCHELLEGIALKNHALYIYATEEGHRHARKSWFSCYFFFCIGLKWHINYFV